MMNKNFVNKKISKNVYNNNFRLKNVTRPFISKHECMKELQRTFVALVLTCFRPMKNLITLFRPEIIVAYSFLFNGVCLQSSFSLLLNTNLRYLLLLTVIVLILIEKDKFLSTHCILFS